MPTETMTYPRDFNASAPPSEERETQTSVSLLARSPVPDTSLLLSLQPYPAKGITFNF